jgi:predicted nucleotidyltransferase
MTGITKNKEDLRKNLSEIVDFMNRDRNVLFAVIFGSSVKECYKNSRDLDIAIYFRDPPQGLEYLSYVNELSDLAGRDVDVVILNNASPFLRHQVMKHGVSVLIKDREIYTNFRERTISDYDEYKYVSGLNIYD